MSGRFHWSVVALALTWLGSSDARALAGPEVASGEDAGAPDAPLPSTVDPDAGATTPPTPANPPTSQAPLPAPPTTEGAPNPNGLEPEETKKKKKKKRDLASAPPPADVKLETKLGTFEVRGHVFALAEYQRRDAVIVDASGSLASARIESFDLLVRDARVAVHYHDPNDWLSVVLDLRITDKPKMKNAYVQAKGHHFLVRAGQFKMPMSSFEMESAWVLPTVDHGFLHELLVKRLDFAGRRAGAIVAWRGNGRVHPKFTAGAFQGSVVTSESADDRKTDPIFGSPHQSQSLVGRAELEAPGFDVGVYYENRIGSPGTLTTDHYWTAGADLAIDQVFSRGGLRVWLDGIAGGSWFEARDKPADGKDATFLAARGLVAYRFGGTTDHEPFVEPFALVGALDPDIDVSVDTAWEGVVGVNAGLWKRARLTLQGEINGARRNFPDGYFVGRPPDRLAILLQAGAAF